MSGLDWKAAIFDRLAKNPLADRLLVFGSAADPDREPKDIDVFVEADAFADERALRDLLRLAREHYGYFDPFLMQSGALFVRSSEATHWVRARNADVIAAAGRAGVPLAEARALAAGPGNGWDGSLTN